MKNLIVKKIFPTLALFIILAACEDDSKQPLPDYVRTAIPVFEVKDDDSGIVNLFDPSATKVSLVLSKEGLADVSSIDVLITYHNGETRESETVVFSNVTTLPATISISHAQLLNAFEPEVLTQDSISVGDSFEIGGAVRLANGMYLNGGYSPSVFTDHVVTVTYNVACTSSIPLGAYTAVSSASSTDTEPDCAPLDSPLSGFSYDVTLTSSGVARYRVSDFFAGVYKRWYGVCYGYNVDTPASFSDVCNNLSFSFADAFGAAVEGTGAYDPVTGKITYTWTNEFGDTGTVILTHK